MKAYYEDANSGITVYHGDEPSMEIAIVAKLRQGPLLRFRLQRGLSQKEAAALAGVSHSTWNAVECLRLEKITQGQIDPIANLLNIPADVLIPEPFRRKSVRLTRIAYARVSAERLFAAEHRQVLLESSAKDEAEASAEMREFIESALKRLTYREREIIKMRFGLGGGHAYTLIETAKVFDVTRERMRQIEAKAICKIRNPVLARKLEGFLAAAKTSNSASRAANM
jgi:RNA polymerase sigma factor (sigma-70 family)